jgi:uncharacterized membrane protein
LPARPAAAATHGNPFSRAWDGLRGEPAFLVLIAAMLLWSIVFGRLVVLRHDHWRTIDFDLGIHDQSIWLLSRFQDFVTVRGLPVFGHHATFGYFFLVPFAWLGAGPNFWNVLQVVAIASSAIPLYLLAKHRLKNSWMASVLGIVWLLQPPLQFFAWETFHPEVMAIPFLLWAYWAAERDRRLLYWVMVVIALSWKEDVALFVVVLGVVQLVRHRRRLGLMTMGLAVAWFAVFALWMVPHIAGGGTVYGPLYGELGSTPGEVVKTAVTNPGKVIDRLEQNDALGYARDLLAPFGFTPLAAPLVLAMGLPQALVNLLSTANFTWDLRYHYQALPIAAAALAMVEGVAWLGRRRVAVRRFAVGFVAACALAATMAWGITPLSRDYRTGYWPLNEPADVPFREQALRTIGPDDGVSVDYWSTPHFTHREIAYTFPNPWRNKNYGISPDDHGDPAKVKWVLVDRSLFAGSAEETALYQALLTSGEFRVVGESGSVVLLQRIAPPGPGTAAYTA